MDRAPCCSSTVIVATQNTVTVRKSHQRYGCSSSQSRVRDHNLPLCQIIWCSSMRVHQEFFIRHNLLHTLSVCIMLVCLFQSVLLVESDRHVWACCGSDGCLPLAVLRCKSTCIMSCLRLVLKSAVVISFVPGGLAFIRSFSIGTLRSLKSCCALFHEGY